MGGRRRGAAAKTFKQCLETFLFALSNCELQLDLPWSRNRIISQTYKNPKVSADTNAVPPTKKLYI